MNTRLLLALLIFVLPYESHAKKMALLFGGSGEDFSKENFFAKDFNRFRDGLTQRGWETETLFNGQKHRIPNSDTATNENIERKLEEMIQKAAPGDEVMLFAHSHGYEHSISAQTHKLMTETPGGFSMDQTLRAAQRLKEKGVKVAITDLSCYSGNTQRPWGRRDKLTAPDACIVTLASSAYVSVCSTDEKENGFTNSLTALPPPEQELNLEDHFMRSRLQDETATNLPEISSAPVPSVHEWGSFLTRLDPSSVDRDHAFSGVAFESGEYACTMTERASSLLRDIEVNIHSLSVPIHRSLLQYPYEDLIRETNRAAAIHRDLQSVTADLNKYFAQNLDWGLNTDDPVSKALREMGKIQDFNRISVGAMAQMLQAIDAGTDFQAIAWMNERNKKMIAQIIPHKEELKRRHAQIIAKAQASWDRYNSLSAQLIQTTKAVLKSEREIYQRYHQATRSKESNPCRDFKL